MFKIVVENLQPEYIMIEITIRNEGEQGNTSAISTRIQDGHRPSTISSL